jgi:NADH-quinone oxidoreductase subunit J
VPASIPTVAATGFELLARTFSGDDERGLILRALALLGLGAVGVYLMLPRGPHSDARRIRWVGAFLAAASLVLMVVVPISGGADGVQRTIFACLGELVPNILFYSLAAISVCSAVLMITSRNPVYAALWFALVLLSNSALYLLQDAEFLSAVTVIVYAGAIIVTFLFVIMLAQPTGTASYDRVSREPALACVAGVLLAAALVGTIHHATTVEAAPSVATGSYAGAVRPTAEGIDIVLTNAPPSWRIAEEGKGHVADLGRSLFLDHYVSIEVIGMLLLAAVVGAMLIASHRMDVERGRSSTK